MRITKSLKPRVPALLAAAAALLLALTVVADSGQVLIEKSYQALGGAGAQQTASTDAYSGKGFKSALFLFRLR